MPPRPRRWAKGFPRNAATCVEWQVAHSASVVSFASSAGLSSDLWIEWQLRQFTAAEFA